ncbi:MAG: two-component system alkaline phosphatase synthesis response regulator PhoP [Candidatus Marivariicella framensis]|jgi:two-component system alkaline phosphatase synthesis response regulator PhoP|tara:strand:- start:26 stop:712 length:687 start_codon:yes stop_codon:yes gene_type:complete
MDKSKIKILLVDDEPDVLEVLSYNLSKIGYQIFTASDGSKAIDKAIEIKPQLIIMDVMMPNMDGIEACEIIRKNPEHNNTTIMFLTARGEDYSQVAAFDAGADDYVTKPIKPKILMSKVKSLLRRLVNLDLNEEPIQIGNLLIDRETYNVTYNNKLISLPKKEFELLFLLASKPEKVIKREEIMEKVWGLDVIVGDRTIDVHIRKLREKFGDDYIKTIKGVGYKFVCK